LLLIAEAMLEIVNEHNRETFPPLDVRIGALCCTCCALLHLLRAHVRIGALCCALLHVLRFVALVACARTNRCALLRFVALVACIH
jgi:hypothetical protein